MKSFVRIVLLLTAITIGVSFYSRSQNAVADKKSVKEILLNQNWAINHILGLDPKTETYRMFKCAPGKICYGNVVQFSDSSTFFSEYTAKCGNDNFTDVSGKYKFVDDDKIAIAAETISYSGEWTKPTEHRKINYLVYSISIVGDSLILKR